MPFDKKQIAAAPLGSSMFERTPLDQLPARAALAENPLENPKQLILCE